MLTRIRPALRLAAVQRFVCNHTVCRVKGHLSTGNFLWWMCDRCRSDFTDIALPSVYTTSGKVTTSPSLF